MEKYKKKISALQSINKAEESQLAINIKYLGGLLAEKEVSLSGDQIEDDLQGKIITVNKEIKSLHSQLKDIEELQEAIADMDKGIKENDAIIKDREKSNIESYEQIGLVGFHVFKDQLRTRGEYAYLFEPLLKHEDEMSTINDSLTDIKQKKDKSIFSAIFDAGKGALLSGSKMFKEMRVSKYYKEVGKNICQSELLEVIDDENFIAVIRPYLDNLQAIKASKLQNEDLLTQRGEIRKKLNLLVEGDQPRHRIDGLNKRKKLAEKESLELSTKLGNMFLEHPLEIADEEINALIGEINSRRRIIKENSEFVTRLEAAVSILQHEKDIKTMNSQVKKFEKEIEMAKKKMADLKSGIKQGQKEIKILEELKGDITDIFPDDIEEATKEIDE